MYLSLNLVVVFLSMLLFKFDLFFIPFHFFAILFIFISCYYVASKYIFVSILILCFWTSWSLWNPLCPFTYTTSMTFQFLHKLNRLFDTHCDVYCNSQCQKCSLWFVGYYICCRHIPFWMQVHSKCL